MAKRLTDTCKWSKPSFSEYTSKQKLMWLYLLDSCDHAGVWDINVKLMSFQLGEPITLDEILNAFKSKVELINDKLLIPGFILFQYKITSFDQLNESNKVHRSVLERLKSLNIKPLASPYLGACIGAKDKDKDKDKEQDKEQDKNTGPNQEAFRNKIKNISQNVFTKP